MEKQQLDNYKQLGLNIAYYRKSKGLSQIQLAEKINISRTHMSRIETADCAVSLDVIFNICDVLEIKPYKLFDFRD
ncbi:MAG: helix-turn-helix transcriptional regulator [Clostridia bacterium]|nr:helix-turn-helix transcriptional regulator [Clostridia bacterium]